MPYSPQALEVITVARHDESAIELYASVENVSNPDFVVDGDIYTARLRRGDGATLTFAEWTATYSYSYPNGVECNRCVHAKLHAVGVPGVVFPQ